MLCGTSCFAAVVFLIANLYVTFTADKTSGKDALYDTLDKKDIVRYEAIVKERRNIYLQGYGLGILIALVLLSLMDRRKMGKMALVCFAGGITLTVNYLYYMLKPKSDYMVLHLNKEDQRQAWLNINRHMQVKYHLGLVLGILAAMLLVHGTC
jgi:uncharacterized membrane protein YkgB